MYKFHAAILAVNRQINHEASQILRENSFVKAFVTAYIVDSSWDDLPIIALGCMASRVRCHAIELTAMSDTEENLNHHPKWIFMFSGDDLTTFCRILLRVGDFGDPKSLLSIAITDLAPSMRILKSMEPFRRLHSIASVKITGNIKAKYKSDLIARILRRAGRDTEAHFQECQDTMEQGDQAATNRDYSIAIAKYRKALGEGTDFDSTYDTCEMFLENENFYGQSFKAAFCQIKFALEMKLATIYYNIGHHTRARAWICLAVDHIQHHLRMMASGGPADIRRYTIAAQVSEGLELAERAAEEMKKQMLHNPGNLDLAAKHERLRSRLDYVKKMLQAEKKVWRSFMGIWVYGAEVKH